MSSRDDPKQSFGAAAEQVKEDIVGGAKYIANRFTASPGGEDKGAFAGDGSDTQHKISSTAHAKKEETKDKAHNTKEAAKSTYNSAKDTVSAKTDELKDKANDWGARVEEETTPTTVTEDKLSKGEIPTDTQTLNKLGQDS